MAPKQKYDPEYVRKNKEKEAQVQKILDQVRSVQVLPINKRPGANAQAYMSGTIRIG